jgi:prepilin-type N-terminal cleavage/methylation domain-containing protein
VFLKPSIRPHRARSTGRGFTLVELMLVVIIVSVMAALAAPVLMNQWRERRGRQEAVQVAGIFTLARARAHARGSAVAVRWRDTTGFTVVESVEGSGPCADQPGLGCLSSDWGTPAMVRTVQTYDTRDIVSIAASNGGSAITKMDICFSPLGRSFISFDGSPPTTPMAGAPTLDVRRLDKVGASFEAAGLTRTVVILPNGMARLAL